MNLQKLVSSEASYEKQINSIIESINKDEKKENILRNIVLFCKQVFSSNTNQRKKYLCLIFIKDIFDNANSQYYEKLVDEYLAFKLQTIVSNYVEGKIRESRTGSEDKLGSEKMFQYAVETIVFWAKRLSFMPKSSFSQVYEELKRMKVQLPSDFVLYRKENIINLWKEEEKQKQTMSENHVIIDLNEKFKQCKEQIEITINQSVLNDEEVSTKPIVEKLRDFLIFFFSRYRELENEETVERDIIIVYFHILNTLYQRICNRIYVSIQEMIALTKEIFQAVYPPEYESVNKMALIELAGVFKYNALTIFQRIHQRIEKQDAILGPYKMSISLENSERPPIQLETGLKSSGVINHHSTRKSRP